ncbi:hypothetical protein JoomaDRAFT_0003 [Galbibacter orientalis DSM 19592]|uniref:DUF4145 domain-containing protein n=1 Tax=Galbibacter orientalis DSM 19592 TaxID=926559 RepID=I3C0C8_9FLAO|nr:DUF4145 domain-containing protein [Galbibacter orientalis]EIJ37071.1 hypothetical protein JoomaDRAFT_0003 [Galbibacter orientalis DSM 19592]
METTKLIEKIEEIEKLYPTGDDSADERANSFYLLSLQFVRNYIGKDTEFYNSLLNYNKNYSDLAYSKKIEASSVLSSVKGYLKLNLDLKKSQSYNLKIDIISDFLNQAVNLANDKKYHPAASAILLGASLEEFLKQLCGQKEVDISEIKKTIDPISQKLKKENIITKQDFKDINSWVGLRNDATHGNFDEVNDRKRVLNAIEGVNLFMRKYSN